MTVLRAPSAARVGWRLVIEPALRSLSWSLICERDGAGGPGAPAEHRVWAGRHEHPEKWRSLLEGLVPHDDAVWDGPLADPRAELAVARELGAALLPRALREGLSADGDAVHTLTVATRGWCAAVPWDALVVDASDTRLLERCRILTEAHPLAAVGRAPAAHRPPPAPGEPDGVVVLDPGPLTDEDPTLAPLYPAGLPPELRDLGQGADLHLSGRDGLGSAELGAVLRERPWARFLYAGHVRPGWPKDPGNVALVLSDGQAADLLPAYDWLDRPDTWPAPERVALIGCGSGDGRASEDVGLPLAALRAGAQLVTATRWVLPADLSEHEPNFTRLVRAVHAAHASTDPVGALRDWQLTELHRWRSSGYALHAPLTWAATTTTVLPDVGEVG
ncbi:CHAT domain-containing protein [Ornithinimicrobium avium]|uniref:CHAT domain-containing protein n=1 Tax=Ornithinimicrobium avium TaxID=2283195 RepID=UPI0013B383A7|nr:CHAT domain-containing protein [Ornithinimicrobium avium]